MVPKTGLRLFAEVQIVKLAGGGVVLLPNEAGTLELGGFEVTVLADEGTTDGAFSLIETGETVAGLGRRSTFIATARESLYVISGSYRMHLDGNDFDCPAGSFVFVPVGMRHTFQSAGPGSPKAQSVYPRGHAWLLRGARGGDRVGCRRVRPGRHGRALPDGDRRAGAGGLSVTEPSRIQLVLGDITRIPADAIVNAANSALRAVAG